MGRVRRGWCGKHYMRWRIYGDPLWCAPTSPDLPGERWLPVVGWEDLYAVSDLARVRSFQWHGRGLRGGVLKPVLAKNGYLMVMLYQGGRVKRCYVHQLVAEAFIGPCPIGEQVRHGPNGKGDNRASQLCYGTPGDNGQDRVRDGTSRKGVESPVAKLTDVDVVEIRRRYATGGETQDAIARDYGVSAGTVGVIVLGQSWRHVQDGPLTVGRSPSERSGFATLTSAAVVDIRARHAAGVRQSALAQEHGVTQRTIRRIITGETWREAV